MMLCRLLEKLDCTLVQGRSDTEVNAICCDSRSVTPGCVFVCLPGQHTDGRRFAHAAAAAGAAVLVFEDTLPDFEFSRSCSPALVQAEPGKARRVLALMAARLYGYPARRVFCPPFLRPGQKMRFFYFMALLYGQIIVK